MLICIIILEITRTKERLKQKIGFTGIHVSFVKRSTGKLNLPEMEHGRAELENVNSIWKVLNRCLPRKDQPLSTTVDHFSQANKFNQFYTSVGLSAASRAKTVAEEHNFYTFNQESNCCPINDSPQDVQCSLFEFQSVT